MATVQQSDPRERANKAYMKTGLGCCYISFCYWDFPGESHLVPSQNFDERRPLIIYLFLSSHLSPQIALAVTV